MDTLSKVGIQAKTYHQHALELVKENRKLDSAIATIERMISDAERRLAGIRSRTSRSVEVIYTDLESSKGIQKSSMLKLHVPLLLANALVLGIFATRVVLAHFSQGKPLF